MYIFTYLYILPEISAYHLQLKCMGGHFFSGPSLHREYGNIESTTVLSDIYIYIYSSIRLISKQDFLPGIQSLYYKHVYT